MLSMFMTISKGDNCSSVNIHVLEVNVASVNVNVYVLEVFFWGGGNVAAVHVHVYVLGGQCCLRTCRCVCY